MGHVISSQRSRWINQHNEIAYNKVLLKFLNAIGKYPKQDSRPSSLRETKCIMKAIVNSYAALMMKAMSYLSIVRRLVKQLSITTAVQVEMRLDQEGLAIVPQRPSLTPSCPYSHYKSEEYQGAQILERPHSGLEFSTVVLTQIRYLGT